MKLQNCIFNDFLFNQCLWLKGEYMSYINAKSVLPKEMIKQIQRYVNGVNLYIPKVTETKRTYSSYQRELYQRNQEIYELFLQGKKVSELAVEYYLSDKSIYRIIGEMKRK